MQQETPGPAYGYSLDTMGRAVGLFDQDSKQVVGGVQYGPGNELLAINYFGLTETRAYNSMLQMTSLNVNGITPMGTAGSVLNMQYRFSAAQNNGKITSQKDMLSGEEVQYTYDSLQRLIAASTTAASDAVTPGWGESFGYDGFGNLDAKTPTKGSVPALSILVDPATNRLAGQSYDANGNLLSLPAGGVGTYDWENRLVSVPGSTYGYDAANKRIWAYNGGVDGWGFGNATGIGINFYGVDGKLLGSYLTNVYPAAAPLLTDMGWVNVYFRGKMVGSGRPGSMAGFLQDRLGSSAKTYPYGEEKTPNGFDGWKFATYLRNTKTVLDYADQRFYSSQLGRFMTADPYKANSGGAGDTGDPASWNRYAYVQGDPVNRVDPAGLTSCDVNGNNCYDSITVTDGPFGIFSPEGGGDNHYGGKPPFWDGFHSKAEFLKAVNCVQVAHPGVSDDEVANNIKLAQAEVAKDMDDAVKANDIGVFLGEMAGWLTRQFLGAWDYKGRSDLPRDKGSMEELRDFGNFNFGAVLASIGWNYYWTQNAAGVAQILFVNRKYSEGTPLTTFPYGDSALDASFVHKGLVYQNWRNAGKCN